MTPHFWIVQHPEVSRAVKKDFRKGDAKTNNDDNDKSNNNNNGTDNDNNKKK